MRQFVANVLFLEDKKNPYTPTWRRSVYMIWTQHRDVYTYMYADIDTSICIIPMCICVIECLYEIIWVGKVTGGDNMPFWGQGSLGSGEKRERRENEKGKDIWSRSICSKITEPTFRVETDSGEGRGEERWPGGGPRGLSAVPTAFSVFQLSCESHCLFFICLCVCVCFK